MYTIAKEKAPGWDAGAARRFATGGRSFADRPSWPAAKAARSLAPPHAMRGPDPSALRRPTRAQRPEQSKGAGSRLSPGRRPWGAFRIRVLRFLLGFCGQDGRALLLPGSLSAAARTRRKKPAGARAGCARVRCQAMDGLSANLRSVLAKSRGHGCPCDRGREGVFSLVTFSCTSKRK